MNTGRVDINNLLLQMRELKMQAQAGALARPPEADAAMRLRGDGMQPSAPDFSTMLGNAINGVNSTSKQATSMAAAWERGDPSVSLSEVLVASEKASISFQAMTEVRNKLVDAYKDIMNMPI